MTQTSLDKIIEQWKDAVADKAASSTEGMRSLTVKVPPEVVDHLTRLATEMKVRRTDLYRACFNDGYAKLCDAEKKVRRVSSNQGGPLPSAQPEAPNSSSSSTPSAAPDPPHRIS